AESAQWSIDGRAEPSVIATEVAHDNGAMLTSCECEPRGSEATVVVSVATRTRMLGAAPRRVTALASAAFDPSRVFQPG
ncbi:MAG: hypothetical protein WD826_12480, partial [Actinomycetota bacterium]